MTEARLDFFQFARAQVMAFTVKGVVDGLESFTGKKISGTTQPNITTDDLKEIIDDAMELALMKAHDMKLRRTGNPSKTVDHPGYEPIVHEPKDDLPFEIVTDGVVDFKTDDVIDILKHRKRVEEMMAKVWGRVEATRDETLLNTHYYSMRFAAVGPNAARL